MRVLLTNDDGIEAAGLQALRRALRELPAVDLAVIAPDGNRSAMARSITTRRPLWVQEVAVHHGTVGYATDGTPVGGLRRARPGGTERVQAGPRISGSTATRATGRGRMPPPRPPSPRGGSPSPQSTST